MITWRINKPRKITADGVTLSYCVGDCLSTDTKPTEGIYNGSSLYEMDTKVTHKFDAESGSWRVSPTAGGNVASVEEVEEVLNNA